MIRKSVQRFSGKIMRKQQATALAFQKVLR
jgi:hypothetical protein